MPLPARFVVAWELLRDRSVNLVDPRDRIGYGLVSAPQLVATGNGGGLDPLLLLGGGGVLLLAMAGMMMVRDRR